jgi:hypothetical protein
MQETSLHAALKSLYCLPGDQQEAWVNGYQVDVLRGELVIEIQTGNFPAIKPKLRDLLASHRVLLVHPIASEKWIIRQDGDRILRRRSPRRGRIEDLFYELVSFPKLIEHVNLSLEVAMVKVEEVRRNDGKGSWRRKGWSIVDRRLLDVVESIRFDGPSDFLRCLPAGLPILFSSRQLASQAKISPGLAQKMTYCLRQMGLLEMAGKSGRAYQYKVKL